MKKKLLVFILVISLMLSNLSLVYSIQDDDPDGAKCLTVSEQTK